MKRPVVGVVLQILLMLCCVSVSAQDLDEGADDRQRRVVKVLRTTNKAQVNQYVPVAFDLKHVNPYAVIRFVKRPIEAEEGDFWTFVHPDGDKGRLVVNVPLWQVEPMKELVALLDRPGLTSSSGDKRVYYRTKHRNPADPGFAAAAQGYMSSSLKYVPDPATAGIFLEDSPSGITSVVNAMNDLIDLPTRQVVIRGKIYEIDVNNDGTLGLDYHAWKNGPGRNLFAVGAFAEYLKTSRRGIDGNNGQGIEMYNGGVNTWGLPNRRIKSSGANVSYFADVSSAYFDFLVTKGKARVLTAPSIATRNTEPAVFSTGEEILYYKVQNGPNDLAGVRPAGMPLDPYGDNGSYPDNRTVVGSTTDRVVEDIAEAGVTIAVTPTIGTEDINLDIAMEVVSQLGFDETGAPMLSARGVETELRVAPGQEYLIGGMTRVRAIQSANKVPLLGSLPVLGWLLGKETTTGKKTMLVMSLSASPIDDYSGLDGDEKRVMDQVELEGMSQIAQPSPSVGFDMMLMGGLAE